MASQLNKLVCEAGDLVPIVTHFLIKVKLKLLTHRLLQFRFSLEFGVGLSSRQTRRVLGVISPVLEAVWVWKDIRPCPLSNSALGHPSSHERSMRLRLMNCGACLTCPNRDGRLDTV